MSYSTGREKWRMGWYTLIHLKWAVYLSERKKSRTSTHISTYWHNHHHHLSCLSDTLALLPPHSQHCDLSLAPPVCYPLVGHAPHQGPLLVVAEVAYVLVTFHASNGVHVVAGVFGYPWRGPGGDRGVGVVGVSGRLWRERRLKRVRWKKRKALQHTGDTCSADNLTMTKGLL